MNTSEWIEAGSEVLADDGTDAASAVNDLLRKFGAHAIVSALADAAAAAHDHCGEGNGTCDEPADPATRKALDELRFNLQTASDLLVRRDEEVAS